MAYAPTSGSGPSCNNISLYDGAVTATWSRPSHRARTGRLRFRPDQVVAGSRRGRRARPRPVGDQVGSLRASTIHWERRGRQPMRRRYSLHWYPRPPARRRRAATAGAPGPRTDPVGLPQEPPPGSRTGRTGPQTSHSPAGGSVPGTGWRLGSVGREVPGSGVLVTPRYLRTWALRSLVVFLGARPGRGGSADLPGWQASAFQRFSGAADAVWAASADQDRPVDDTARGGQQHRRSVPGDLPVVQVVADRTLGQQHPRAGAINDHHRGFLSFLNGDWAGSLRGNVPVSLVSARTGGDRCGRHE